MYTVILMIWSLMYSPKDSVWTNFWDSGICWGWDHQRAMLHVGRSDGERLYCNCHIITCRVINIILRYHNFSCIMWSTWFFVIWMIKLFLVLHSSILVRAVTNSTIILPIILTLKKENTITEKIQQETMWLQEHIRL